MIQLEHMLHSHFHELSSLSRRVKLNVLKGLHGQEIKGILGATTSHFSRTAESQWTKLVTLNTKTITLHSSLQCANPERDTAAARQPLKFTGESHVGSGLASSWWQGMALGRAGTPLIQ